MKKKLLALLAVICMLCACAFIACNPSESTNESSSAPTPTMMLGLRSPDTVDLQVGELFKIVYVVKGTDQGVAFESSNESVLKVDDFGNIDAIGAGQAIVTLSLKEDPSITQQITFNVTKSFFINKVGFKNGSLNLENEGDGLIEILGDQAQVLVSEYGEQWYFKCRIVHTGQYTNFDGQGRWGVGSFNVTDSLPIGEVMAWFGMKPHFLRGREFVPFVGGWRVQTAGQDPELKVFEDDHAMNCKNSGAVLELIRYGTMHYFTVTANGEVAKYAYDCPAYAGVPTYPGIFSQNQILEVYDFEASSNEDFVWEKLNNFQRAEQVAINGVGEKLVAGEKYQLTSTVLPTTTFDKSVTYSLKETVNGVSLSENGALELSESASGQITVVVTANSNGEVKDEKTYTIISNPTSTSTVVNTGLAIGNATENNGTVTLSGNAYMPLIGKGENWAVTFTLSTTSTSGKVGLIATQNGFFNYSYVALNLVSGAERKASLGVSGATAKTFTYASDASSTEALTITVVKKGSEYFYIVNGVMRAKEIIALEGELTPVIYTQGAEATVTEVAYTTDIEEIISAHKYTVGAYVKENNGVYTLASKNFGNAGDMNWPPVNGYANGIKSTTTFTSSQKFSIEFTIDNVKPMEVGNGYDGKILVYLRSETRTASIQFVIKGKVGSPEVFFCPNLNDATWIEYPMVEGVDLLNGANTIKIVKNFDAIEVYINGNRVFEATLV